MANDPFRTQPRKVAVIRGKAKHTFVNIAEEEDGPKNPQFTTKELHELFSQQQPPAGRQFSEMRRYRNTENTGMPAYLKEIGKIFRDWVTMYSIKVNNSIKNDTMRLTSEILDNIRECIYIRALSITLDESIASFRYIRDNDGHLVFYFRAYCLSISDVRDGVGNIDLCRTDDCELGLGSRIVLFPRMSSYDE